MGFLTHLAEPGWDEPSQTACRRTSSVKLMIGTPMWEDGVWYPPCDLEEHTSQICSWDGGIFSDVKLFMDQSGLNFLGKQKLLFTV